MISLESTVPLTPKNSAKIIHLTLKINTFRELIDLFVDLSDEHLCDFLKGLNGDLVVHMLKDCDHIIALFNRLDCTKSKIIYPRIERKMLLLIKPYHEFAKLWNFLSTKPDLKFFEPLISKRVAMLGHPIHPPLKLLKNLSFNWVNIIDSMAKLKAILPYVDSKTQEDIFQKVQKRKWMISHLYLEFNELLHLLNETQMQNYCALMNNSKWPCFHETFEFIQVYRQLSGTQKRIFLKSLSNYWPHVAQTTYGFENILQAFPNDEHLKITLLFHFPFKRSKKYWDLLSISSTNEELQGIIKFLNRINCFRSEVIAFLFALLDREPEEIKNTLTALTKLFSNTPRCSLFCNSKSRLLADALAELPLVWRNKIPDAFVINREITFAN